MAITRKNIYQDEECGLWCLDPEGSLLNLQHSYQSKMLAFNISRNYGFVKFVHFIQIISAFATVCMYNVQIAGI